MALFTENENVRCECGNDIFTDVEIFRIVKKPNKSTLTTTIKVEKDIIGKKIQCTACKKVMDNPLNN